MKRQSIPCLPCTVYRLPLLKETPELTHTMQHQKAHQRIERMKRMERFLSVLIRFIR
jgi:hypothetical protein